MSLFVILLGGDLIRTPLLDRQIADARFIAADSGIRHAGLLGVTPELWIGDFDSVPETIRAKYPEIPTAIFPHEKDKTDGELAIDAAFDRGATALVLAGAFGGQRTDHAFLHLASALRLAEAGTPVILTSGAQEAHPLLPGDTDFSYEDGTLFSVLGFSALSGLTLSGVKWPLLNADIPFGSSHTLSNEVKGDLKIGLRVGRALLLAHPFPSLGI